MYKDLMWAMEVLNDKSSSEQNWRMATTIFQAWMGEVAQMRVHHQENASNIPIEAWIKTQHYYFLYQITSDNKKIDK